MRMILLANNINFSLFILLVIVFIVATNVIKSIRSENNILKPIYISKKFRNIAR